MLNLLQTPRTITEHMEAMFRASMAGYSKDKGETRELVNFAGPYLARRYGEARGLNVLEVGPRGTTVVARSLQGSFASYVGLDWSLSCVDKQRENFAADGIMRASAVCGSTYYLPFADESQDVVFASCHDAVASGTEDELVQAFSEIRRVLKPTGEFVLLPWFEAQDLADVRQVPPGLSFVCRPQWLVDMPFRFFDPVESEPSTENNSVPPRTLLVMHKK